MNNQEKWQKWGDFFPQQGQDAHRLEKGLVVATSNEVTERTARACRELQQQREQMQEVGLFPRTCVVADKDCIENQEVNFIQVTDTDYSDSEVIRVQFKLTTQHQQKIASFLARQGLNQGHISYKYYHFCPCVQKNIDDIIIKVSSVQATSQENRSGIGLVEIIVPPDKLENEHSLGAIVHEVLQTELGIADGLDAPTPEAENDYKKARYAWHHKLTTAPPGIEDKLVRTEVAPEYYTFVEPGKHAEYKKMGSYIVCHSLDNVQNLPSIIKAGGLLSTHERYRRGLLLDGCSSITDINSGGADSVFTRVSVLNEGWMREQNNAVALVFDPDILDRTDWFSYLSDNYGSTKPEIFKDRSEPVQFMERLASSPHDDNEAMFRTGISSEKIRYINCRGAESMFTVYKMLIKAGITHIHNQPIEKMIKNVRNLNELVKLSNGDTYEEEISCDALLNQKRYKQKQSVYSVTSQLRQINALRTVFEHTEDELAVATLKDECKKFFEYVQQWSRSNHPIHAIVLPMDLSAQDQSILRQEATQALEVIGLWRDLMREKNDTLRSVVPNYFDSFYGDESDERTAINDAEFRIGRLLDELTPSEET